MMREWTDLAFSSTYYVISKLERARLIDVVPEEGLWSAEDLSDFTRGDKSQWSWTMMVRQPTGSPLP